MSIRHLELILKAEIVEKVYWVTHSFGPCVGTPKYMLALGVPNWMGLCNTCALQCQHLPQTPAFASPALPATSTRRKAKPWWMFSAAPFTGPVALGTLPLCTFGQKAWRGSLASCIVSTQYILFEEFWIFTAHIYCWAVKLTAKNHIHWQSFLERKELFFTFFSKTAHPLEVCPSHTLQWDEITFFFFAEK